MAPLIRSPIPTVILDGEPVLFEGAPAPASAQALGQMLIAALNEQGRVLTHLSIDGVDALECDLPENAPYRHVECKSLKHGEFLLIQAQNQEKYFNELPGIASQLSMSLLHNPWETSLKSAQAFATTLGPAIEVLEACQQFFKASDSLVADSINAILAKIGPLLDHYTHCVEISDSGSLAEQMLTSWVPWSNEARIIFSEKLLPELKMAS